MAEPFLPRFIHLLRTLVREQFEMMSTDADAIAQLEAAGADLSALHTILHYIYVPNRGSVDSIANELRQRGFRIETASWRGRRKLARIRQRAILT